MILSSNVLNSDNMSFTEKPKLKIINVLDKMSTESMTSQARSRVWEYCDSSSIHGLSYLTPKRFDFPLIDIP